MKSSGIPLPTIRRLPFYLRLFKEEATKGSLWISSEAVGKQLDLGAIQVRKDLSLIGAEGRARCGFPVKETIRIISSFLGNDDYADIFLIGAGSLASALFTDNTLARHGFKVIAVFDPDSSLVGSECGGHDVLPITKLSDLVRRMGVKIAVVCLSSSVGSASVLEAVKDSPLLGLFDLSGLNLEFPSDLLIERDDIGSRLAKIAGCLGASRTRQ